MNRWFVVADTAPVNVPVVGQFEGLDGFDGLSEEMSGQVDMGEIDLGGGRGGGGALAGLGAAEIGSDVATGGKAGIFGQISSKLGGMSKGMMAAVGFLAAIVGFVAMLEPVQEVLKGLFRFFELLVLPVLAPLLPVMESIQGFVVDVIQFFKNPMEFMQPVVDVLKQIGNFFISGINSVLGAVGLPKIDRFRLSGGSGVRTGADVGRTAGGIGQEGLIGQLMGGPSLRYLSAPLDALGHVMRGEFSSLLADLSGEGKKARIEQMSKDSFHGTSMGSGGGVVK